VPLPTTRVACRQPLPAIAGLVVVMMLAAGCSGDGDQGSNVDQDQVDAMTAPELGACRDLVPDDVSHPSNASKTVDCSDEHTAQTYAVGPLPKEFEDADYEDEKLGAYAYRTCAAAFQKFLGGDESLVMRSVLNWAWFRPSEKAWDKGARWYRCDVVGGSEQSEDFVKLPKKAKGLLFGPPPDKWLVCANGKTVAGSEKVPCTEKHTWRAVSTIKVGDPDDPYPGDEAVERQTRDFCSSSVGAWLSYPVDYDFGYTWFHEAEWKAGNRRSICWARTTA
jgi:hypothetical protein